MSKIKNQRFKGKFMAMLLLCLGFMPVCAQEGLSIINECSDINYASLNARQRTNYNIVAANPNVKEIKLIRLNNLSNVQDSGKVILDLPFSALSQYYFPCKNGRLYQRQGLSMVR
jgi:hypothetical protein